MDPVASLRRTLARRERRTLEREERAAVLVPLIDDEGPLRLLLTRRTREVPTHQGQVAFPGGRVETGDADAAATALREACEEIALPSGRVEVLGLLDDHLTRGERTAVTPVLGRIAELPDLRPRPEEVARVFTIPFGDLTVGDRWETRGGLHFFRHEGEVLWGMSARIVLHLLSLIGS